MKKTIFSLAAILMLAFVSSTYAQDDLYFDPSDNYFQEEIAEVEKTTQQERRSNTRTASFDDGFCYASRIRRFSNNYRGFNYYDPCYTDGFYYNPAFAGRNIYLANSPYAYYGNFNSRNGWNVWNSPYNTYGSSYNSYYNSFSNPYAYGFNSFSNNAAYCPPASYGSYVASTPGNSNTAPRGTRTSNYSNPTATPRSGSGRSGSNPNGVVRGTRDNTPSSTNTTNATRRSTRNTPSATSSTRSSRTSTATKPSTSTRNKRTSSRFGSLNSNRNSSSTRSSRSNSSYKPSSTRSNSSFRSGSSTKSSRGVRSSSSRGGRN